MRVQKEKTDEGNRKKTKRKYRKGEPKRKNRKRVKRRNENKIGKREKDLNGPPGFFATFQMTKKIKRYEFHIQREEPFAIQRISESIKFTWNEGTSLERQKRNDKNEETK